MRSSNTKDTAPRHLGLGFLAVAVPLFLACGIAAEPPRSYFPPFSPISQENIDLYWNDMLEGCRRAFLFTWAASTIARLYKCRWQVELFFKWIKQHLKVKTFLGTSLNAVMTQICIAMIVFVLVALIKHRSQSSLSMIQVQRKTKSSLFHRLDLSTVIDGPPTEPASVCENQLLLNLNQTGKQ